MIVEFNILITLPDMPSYVHHFSQITEEDPENQNNYKLTLDRPTIPTLQD